ncbi:MAG TPA: hypothetical protein VGJ26_13590 [Pirellulales bacterium]
MLPSLEPTRRWFQFGLKSLLIVVTLLAVVAAFVAHRLNQPKLLEFDSKVWGDPSYDIVIKEIKRSGNISTVTEDFKKGHSVGSAMFFTRSIHEIAKARNAEYWVLLKHWKAADGTRICLFDFTNVKDADIKVEFGDEFTSVDDEGKKRSYTSVSEMDSLFGAISGESKPSP